MDDSLDSLKRPSDAPAPRRRIPAWSIPAAIALGFALLFLLLFRDRLLPATAVDVAVVLATSGDAPIENDPDPPAADGPMAFQASGWVEPDPLPIKATALVDGVVDQVHVLEGEAVRKGDLLATLIDDDHRLALARAERMHEQAVAEKEAHEGTLVTAERSIAAAEARAGSASAVVRGAEDRVRRYQNIRSAHRGSIAESEVVDARSRRDAAEADELAAREAVAEAKAELARLKLVCLALDSSIRTAAVAVDKAKLDLSRTRIVSPVDGRVLRLLAAPGQKKMLAMDDPDSATVAILYQPQRLQVRVDVPLADAAGLQIGQKARIRCSLLPDTVFHGEVTRITGEADLQRNTLQAKVRIDDPVDELRPEMLCRAEFLETRGADAARPATGALATWIPEAALSESSVWICDPDSRRVSRREVEPAGETRDGHARIRSGLRPGEWVVLSPSNLRDGQRVKPRLPKP